MPSRGDHASDVPDPHRAEKPVEVRRRFDEEPEVITPLDGDLIVEDIGQRRAEYAPCLFLRRGVPLENLSPVLLARAEPRDASAPVDSLPVPHALVERLGIAMV